MDRLGQAANILQVTGLDAYGLVSMIMQAAHTARHNKERCQQLAEHVQTVGDLLRKLDVPALRRHPETRRPLVQLDATLLRAFKLVRSCSQDQDNTSRLYQIMMGAEVASKLRQAQEEIDRFINLIPMITLVAIVGAQQDTQEVQEDVTNDPAPTQRPPLSLQEVTEFLAIDEPPPQSLLMERQARTNDTQQQQEEASLFSPDPPRVLRVVLDEGVSGEVLLFSHKELWQATQGFSDKEKLGFGSFYRGFLRDGDLYVAIKRVSKSSGQDFGRIIYSLDRLSHPNIVQFIGCCQEAGELFLVFEYLTNGCLETNLYSSANILTWAMRYKIIQGLGSALVYLHHELDPSVVHGNIKPSNVMLDSSFNAKLGDFIHGHGYIPPGDEAFEDAWRNVMLEEYSDVFSKKKNYSDVYSFGVVVLEIVCGRRPMFWLEAEESEVRLVQWVWGLYGRHALLDAADPRLKGEFDKDEMIRALVVGLWCVHPDRSLQPSIQEAMRILRVDEQLPDLPRVMPVRR